MRNKVVLLLFTALVLTSCGSQKSLLKGGSTTNTTRHADPSVAFVEDVIEGEVGVENIVGSASIKLQFGSESMKLSGALRMKRDKVVRLQLMLPLIGTEVGRMEFTPDHVLIMDRINKQYVRVDYDQVDFLARNNISFYTLQALFWDELIATNGEHVTSADAANFSANLDDNSSFVPITVSQGNIKYQWHANRNDHTLTSAIITHNSVSNDLTMVTWLYSNFILVNNKKFPRTQELSFSTTINGTNRRGTVTIDMDEIKTSSDWDAETEVSSKYKQVSVETVLSRLMSL